MGVEESLPSLPATEFIVNVTDSKCTSIPYLIKDHNKIFNLNIVKAQIKKFPLFPKLTCICYHYAKLTSIPSNLVTCLLASNQIESIDFSHNKLTSIPVELCNISTLKQLCLCDNLLNSISLQNCPASSIDLGMNNLDKMPALSNHLESITLDYNNISVLSSISTRIQKLSISHNKISEIGISGVFPSLTILDLSYNELTSLENINKMFPSLKNLDISNNNLTELKELPETIEELRCNSNQLTNFPDNFSELKVIKIANFSDNQIESIPQLPSSLLMLFVYNNNITSITDSRCPKMTHIFMMRNKIENIPNIEQNRITEMNLSFNNLSNLIIPPNMIYITDLDLSNNNLESLPPEIFNITYLRRLSAINNKLITIPDTITNSRLISLNLSLNNIEHLPELPFTLEELHMVNCGLKTIDFYNDDNEELIYVDFSGNELKEIFLLPWFEKVVLSSNKFQKIPDINNTLQYLDLSNNQIGELPSESLDHSSLKYLDLSSNNLQSFALKMPFLETLKINNNPNLSCLFNIALTPSLQVLEYVNTNGFKIKGDLTLSRILSSVSQEKTILSNFTAMEGFSSTVKGISSISEDVSILIKDLRKDTRMMAMFNGTDSFDAPSYAARLSVKYFDAKNTINACQTLKSLTAKIARTVDEAKNFSIRDLCFVFLEKAKITVDTFGSMYVLVITKEGKVRLCVRQESALNYGPSAVQSSISTFISSKAQRISHYERRLLPNDKWIAILSPGVIRYTPIETIEYIAQNSIHPAEFAQTLRNIAFSYNPNENISISIADTQYTLLSK